MAFSIFTELCDHNHIEFLEYFCHPKKKPHGHFQSLPFSSLLPQSYIATNVLPVSIDLPILDISYK